MPPGQDVPLVAEIMGGLQLLVSAPIGFTVGPPDGNSNQQWKDWESRGYEIRKIKQSDRQQHVNHAYRKNSPHGFDVTGFIGPGVIRLGGYTAAS
jgi:hypothetical protein